MQALDISYNNISNEGAVYSNHWNNKKLQELNVSCNKIFYSGIIKIGTALETN